MQGKRYINANTFVEDVETVKRRYAAGHYMRVVADEIINMINSRSTGYDVEKVIDQLKAESLILDNDAGHRAVEIIEAGGVGNV